MVMGVGRDGPRGNGAGDNPFREAIEVINALAEEGDFEFEEAERMAQREQDWEDRQQRRPATLATPENPPPRQSVPHSFGLHSLRHPGAAEENYGPRMTNGDADDEEEEEDGGVGGGEEDDDEASSGGDSVILLPRGITPPRKQIERKEEEEGRDRKWEMLERRHEGEEEKENSENGATIEVRRANPVPPPATNAISSTK